MIKIAINDIVSEYKDVLKDWFDFYKVYKSGKSKGQLQNKISKAKDCSNEPDKQYNEMLDFVFNNFEKLMSDDFISIADDFLKKFESDKQKFDKAKREYDKAKKEEKNTKKEELKQTSLSKFTDKMIYFYEIFFKADYKGKGDTTIYKDYSNGTWLASRLNVNICPYCNRQYTFTIDNNGVRIRPQFDHFYPKSQYPCLALSFYNLIPSCPTCNKIKSDKPITINPHFQEFGNDYKFEIQTKDNDKAHWTVDKDNIKICFKRPKNKNIEVFGLEPLYNGHKDYVAEIIDKAQAYNSAYYDSLIQSFSGLGKTPAEIDRFVWGNYLETADHDKRSLSKLTRDILEQLGLTN